GALIRLAASGHTSDSHRLQDEVDEVRILTLDTDGDDRFGVLGRRPLLVGSTATVAAWASSSTSSRDPAGALPTKKAELVLTSFIAIFDQLRQLGQWLSPGLLVPQLATQVHALRNLAVRSMPAGRSAALVLAARFAEYAGWLTQEAGDDARALWWTDR